jgi:hypothetical protein
VHQIAHCLNVGVGQRIDAGDLIISRCNDSTTKIYQAQHDVPAADPVRNGNRMADGRRRRRPQPDRLSPAQ